MTLRVTLEIVPFGDEDKKRTIRQLDIFNMGQHTLDFYEYGIIDIDPENNNGGLHSETVYHRRKYGAVELVRKVLEQVIIPNN